jgi:hypothetical protein
MVVQRFVDPKVIRAVAEQARHDREIHKKGTMLGNTQRHWRKIGSLPSAMHAQLKERMGSAAQDPKAWRKLWNSGEYAEFRASEGRV